MKVFGINISKRAAFRIGAILLTLIVLGTSVGIYAKYAREVSVKGSLTVGGDPIESEPVESEPAESEPTESEPAESEPAKSEPDESEPVESEPVESEPAESEPDESEPAESEPVGSEEAQPAVPEVTAHVTASAIAPVEIEAELDYYLFIEVSGKAEMDPCWTEVEGVSGKKGGAVYVYSNGGVPLLIDPDSEMFEHRGEDVFVNVGYESAEEAEIFGYIVPAYDGESLASLFGNA